MSQADELGVSHCSDSYLLEINRKVESGDESLIDEHTLCMRERKDYRAVESDIKRYFSINGEDANAYILLAEAYAFTHRCDMVLPTIKKAINIRPNGMSLYVDGADFLSQCGSDELAITLLKSGISLTESELQQESESVTLFFPALEDAKDLLEKLSRNHNNNSEQSKLLIQFVDIHFITLHPP
ncbi:tetratricopeptide repeat protein [Microbulbifer hainanensis]|uniref:tetratricopeptide repeat protein n=1 Tax=Microbulbifer hainanensis TaxID=2735675 RepID=UPI001866E8C8|nr:hypothetical protein [Microbulbifer hainanensis]